MPDTTRSFSPSLTSLTSLVISSIEGILLSISEDSILEPEPTLIVGKPFRSDFTYALIIFMRSPGFNSLI